MTGHTPNPATKAKLYLRLMSYQTLAFYRVDERFVDEILQRLSVSRRLPGRVMVFATDANLLAALDQCWARDIRLNAVLLPSTMPELMDTVEAILEFEQVDARTVVWVDGSAGGDMVQVARARPWISAGEGAESIETTLNLLLEPRGQGGGSHGLL